MKKPTRVNHPPDVELPPGNQPLVAPIYQSVKFEFDTLEDTERFLRGERPGFFYSRGVQSDHAAARAAARGAAGARATAWSRPPASAAICPDAARADQAGRSRPVLRRDLQPDPLSDPAPARAASASPTRCCPSRISPASSGCWPRSRRAWCSSRARPIRSPRSPTSPALTRLAHAAGALTVHGQHLCRLSPARRLRRRPLRAQPHQVRLRRRRCHGRRGHRPHASSSARCAPTSACWAAPSIRTRPS